MQILVTGSNGFIGKSLVKRLVQLDHEVIAYDQDNGDIAKDRLHYANIGHVFHLASKVYVPDSWGNTFDFYQTNVLGTINVLELCRENSCSLTYISSYVYGDPQYLPVNERHPVNPASPYNHSKLIAEEICKYYSETFQFPIAILRPVNIFGVGQHENFLIPKIIQQVLDPAVENVEVMNLRPKRDFLYIDDFINAIISTLNINKFEIFNIGSGISKSVEEIIETVMKISGKQKPYHDKKVERENEIWDVYVDISKIQKSLGWKPKFSFEEGIQLCLDKNNL